MYIPLWMACRGYFPATGQELEELIVAEIPKNFQFRSRTISRLETPCFL